jgi:hypothetical protein
LYFKNQIAELILMNGNVPRCRGIDSRSSERWNEEKEGYKNEKKGSN